MNYQQSPYTVDGTKTARAKARRYQITLPLSDPALVAVNEQGMLTPEQLTILARQKYNPAGGCVAMAVGLLFAFFATVGAAGEHFTLVSLIAYLPTLLLFGLGWFMVTVCTVARKRFIARVTDSGYFYPIVRVQGEVIWRGRSYVAHSPERALRVSRMHLPPGPYHFFCSQDDNRILSVQPIHTYTQMLTLPGTLAATGLSGDEQARLAIQQALCQMLGFTIEDLEANRQGLITPGQTRKLPRQKVRGSYPVVQTLTGAITTAEKDSGDETTHYYDMTGMRFEVPQFADKALVNGIQYRVYYILPATLLSVEPLEAPRR